MYYTAVADHTPRVVVPSYDGLRLRIMFECNDAPTGGHRGREKTYIWLVVTFTGIASINSFASTFVLVRSVVGEA